MQLSTLQQEVILNKLTVAEEKIEKSLIETSDNIAITKAGVQMLYIMNNYILTELGVLTLVQADARLRNKLDFLETLRYE